MNKLFFHLKNKLESSGCLLKLTKNICSRFGANKSSYEWQYLQVFHCIAGPRLRLATERCLFG